MGNEIVILSDDNVTVTNSRLVIGGTTYAMRNITSVACVKMEPDTTAAWQCTIWGIVLMCVGIGLVLEIIAIYLFATAKPRYALAVRTSGGEQHALEGSDPDFIQKVAQAINDAMASNG